MAELKLTDPSAASDRLSELLRSLEGAAGGPALEAAHRFLTELSERERGWRRLETEDPGKVCDLAESLLALLPPGDLDPAALPDLGPDTSSARDAFSAGGSERGGAMLPDGPSDLDASTERILRIRAALWEWLDATRRSPFLRRIERADQGDRWLALVLAVIDRTHFTFRTLLYQRVRAHPDRTWLRLVGREHIEDLTLGQVAQLVTPLSRGLQSLFSSRPSGQPVAILAENRLETVLADLACLSGGLVNVTIPADATGEQAAFILEQAEVRVLLVGSDRQIEKISPHLPSLPHLRWLIQIASPESAGPSSDSEAEPVKRVPRAGVAFLSFKQLLQRGREFSQEESESRARGLRSDDVATIMYTSGTTGQPKGILFSHRNIVFKRFARALALPEIGEEDHLLCYLPLYHTFGRWLEMTGSLFWGATYAFMENPSLEAMCDNLRRAAPTLFISIPKKWIQLHDRIRAELPEDLDPRLARPFVENSTGGRLRWGLSAAGYLDPAVFRFFQRHGLELMSGFGMTEATGGITMTPPGDYREGTVGRALPGVEITRAEDGELLVRGPYVMKGYFGPDEAKVDQRTAWFHTGDIVEIDEDGFVTILDRKKDIYKNVKGQTIAPQRVESLFQSFSEIRQVFLAGDGREYNTLLIFPAYDHPNPPLNKLPADDLREYLSSVIVSVNGFLAPFERILDFALLPRALSEEEGELTPKGTYRRKVIEQHFTDLIEGMYQATASVVSVGGIEVRLPHWLLRDMGLTMADVLADDGALRLPRLGRSLRLSAGAEPGRYEVGHLTYEGPRGVVDLEVLLRSPELWLGNVALVDFTGLAGIRRPQSRRESVGEAGLRVVGEARVPELSETHQQQLEDALWREDRSLHTLHLVASALLSAREKEGLRLIGYLEALVMEEDTQRAELARVVLRRAIQHPRSDVRSAAFRALVPYGAPEMVAPTVTAFLQKDPAVLNAAGAAALTRRGLSEEVMAAFLTFVAQVFHERELQRRSRDKVGGSRKPFRSVLDEKQALALLRFLVVYAVDHPGWFQSARQELSRWLLSSETLRIRDFVRRGLERMTEGFRAWLGPDPSMALDPVNGREYGWAQVLRFDPTCSEQDRRRIETAIVSVPLIKESVFILSGGARVSLAEIPPGGVQVRHLGSRHDKTVYHVSVQTRQHGPFEMALNLAQDLTPEEVESEILWLIRLGSPEGRRRLVEEFGGYWPAHRMWTEEYVPGETVTALLDRLARDEASDSDRLLPLWAHLASSAATAYIDFWSRTGRTLIPGDPSPDNLIVPGHDYQEGSRLVSISHRRSFAGLPAFLRDLKAGILDAVSERLEPLRNAVGCEVLYAAVLDVLGEAEGVAVLTAMLEDPEMDRELPGEREHLDRLLSRIKISGYMPRRLAAAVRRYHRWAQVNREATPSARASTLRDLWESYGLRELEEGRPETRLQFFRETVFAADQRDLGQELERLIGQAREGRLTFEVLLREMSELVRRLPLTEEETYLLARMTYAHLRPADTADLALMDQGGTRVSDLIVTHRDQAGRYFRVRHAATPREVWGLHSLFRSSGISIRFRTGHHFLVAVDENNRVIGGLVYRQTDTTSVHMEKIVVSPTHRRLGISEELMEDFFQRMRSRGVEAVTTGFFRPQYFRRFHFEIDREHAGLVRLLGNSDS